MDLYYAGAALKASCRALGADRTVEWNGQCPVVERFPACVTWDTCKLECAGSDPRECQTTEIPDGLFSFKAAGPVPAFAKLEHRREASAPGFILMVNRHAAGIKLERGNRKCAGRRPLRLRRRAVDGRRRCGVCKVLIERCIRWHDMIMRVHDFTICRTRNNVQIGGAVSLLETSIASTSIHFVGGSTGMAAPKNHKSKVSRSYKCSTSQVWHNHCSLFST